MSTHNQCFRAKIRNNVYPGKPQFYCIKVGCNGVFVTRTCFHDEKLCYTYWERAVFLVNHKINVHSLCNSSVCNFLIVQV